jgi:UDP-glucose 4-epimerase
MTTQHQLASTSANQTVLVTGAAGLIGSATTRLLLSKNFRVIACDNFSIGNWRGISGRLIWEELDVSNRSFIERLTSYDVDLVVHCAAHPGGQSLIEPVRDVEVNVLGSMRLFEWCAKVGKPVIFTSSSSVYGDLPHEPIKETAPLHTGTIYGACKIACENFLRILGEGYGLKWVVLRLFSVFGAGHRPSKFQGIVNVMLTQLLAGNRVVVKGSLDRVRDLVYVNDVADAVCKSIYVPEAFGQIINIGTGNGTTIRDLIHALIRALGRQLEDVEIVQEQGTVGDPFYIVGDCDKAQNILGFLPKYDLEKGLSEFVNQPKSDD